MIIAIQQREMDMNTQKPKPQAGMYAYVIDRGRVWVESFNSLKQTALVRFDCNTGMRSRCHTVPLSQVDFTREWKFV